MARGQASACRSVADPADIAALTHPAPTTATLAASWPTAEHRPPATTFRCSAASMSPSPAPATKRGPNTAPSAASAATASACPPCPKCSPPPRCGLRVLGLSTVTNVACPDAPKIVSAEEVVEVAPIARPRVRAIVRGILWRQPSSFFPGSWPGLEQLAVRLAVGVLQRLRRRPARRQSASSPSRPRPDRPCALSAARKSRCLKLSWTALPKSFSP